MKRYTLILGMLPVVSLANTTTLPEMTVTTQPQTKAESRTVEGVQVIKTNTALNRSFVDQLSQDPEVTAQATGPQQQSPYVHGFTGYDNVLLIDGIRMNNPIMRSGPNQYGSTIDPYTVDQASLYFGQSAMLYGSDAFGTALNVSTRKREDYSGEGFNWNGRTAYRFASAEASNIGRAEFEGNYGATLGFLVGTSIKGYRNMEGGSRTGIQPNTGYDEQDMDARFDWKITNRSTLTFAHQQYASNDAMRNHRMVGATANIVVGAADGTYEYDTYDQSRQLSYVKLESSEIPVFDTFSSTFSLQEADQFNAFKKANLKPIDSNGRQEQTFADKTIGLNVKASNDTRIGKLTYGVDYYHDSVSAGGALFKSNGSVTHMGGPPPVADESKYNTLGVYVSDDVYLVPDKLLLSLTSRYNYADVSTGQIVDNNNKPVAKGLSSSWDSFTSGGRLSLGIDEDNHYKVFLGANQGWRAPTLVDLSGNALALSGILQTPSPTIAPEKFVTYESGIGYSAKSLDAVLTVFRTNLDDSINKPTSAAVPADNRSYGYTQGISFKSDYAVTSDLKTFIGLAWTEGYLTSYDAGSKTYIKDTISKVNPITGNLGLHYSILPSVFVEGTARFVGPQERLAASDLTDTTRIPVGGSRGYSLYGIRVGWAPIKSLILTGAVDNLLDKDYRSIGSGINGLGRNFVISADYRF